MRFALQIEPPTATAQQKRHPRAGRCYDPPNVAEARAKLIAHLAPHAPAEPMTGPLGLSVTWMHGTQDLDRLAAPKTTHPDLDNICKILLDAMTKCGFWQDDAQVADLRARKVWWQPAGIAIELWRLES